MSEGHPVLGQNVLDNLRYYTGVSPADTVVTEVWGMHPEKFEKSFPIIHQAHSGYKSEVYAADCKLILSPGTAATYTLGQLSGGNGHGDTCTCTMQLNTDNSVHASTQYSHPYLTHL